jgi:cysteine desulfuration protein SufE
MWASHFETPPKMCYESGMSTIAERQKLLLAEFKPLEDWEARYRHIIAMGHALPALPDEFKIDQLKVQGCQSQVWLKAELNQNGEMVLRADSDALIVKGLVAMLLKVFSPADPGEVLAADLGFLKELGLAEHLSPSRANGLLSMIKQIKYYAAALQMVAERR